MLKGKILIDIIKADRIKKQGRYAADEYYNYKPTQNERYVDIQSNGKISTIDTHKGATLYTNYFRLLVDQKIEYLLAEEVTAEMPELTDLLIDGIYDASLHTTAWLYAYIYDGKLQYTFVHDKEIIPIYNNYGKELETLIRYYNIDDKTTQVEVWTPDSLTKMEIRDDKVVTASTEAHFVTETVYQGKSEGTEERFFGQIPFIPLYNNRDKESDLVNVKELLDVYNTTSSGFVSNIEEFQEALIKLTGFAQDEESLIDTMRQMKQYKMVQLPDQSDVSYLNVEIPTVPRELLLRLVKDNIFLLGKGVDSSKVGDGGNITNVVIKSRYAALDMKCNNVEKELKKFYRQLIEFSNKYASTNYADDLSFNKTLLVNESELTQDIVKSLPLVEAGLVSKQTLMKNIPWVVDLDEEVKQIELEAKEKPKGDAK